MISTEYLVKKFDSMFAEKANWTDHWEDVLRYVAPHKNRIYNDTKGEKRGQRLYDSSAQHFVELLASALHSMLTNPSVEWFGFSTGVTKTDRKTNVRKYIKKLVTRVHDVLNNTNFQTEMHELYMDLASLGTGAMYIEKDDEDVLRFLTTPIFELCIRENHKGIVDTVARTIKMTPEQALEKYGEEAFGAKLDDVKRMKSDQKIEILHMIEPRLVRDKEKKDKKNKAFASYHIWKSEKIMLKEDGFDKNPWIIPRWTKLGNEVYGRSPAMKTLPDIKMLNSIMKSTLRGAQKAVDPPTIVQHDSVLGRMNIASGGITTVRHGVDKAVTTLGTGARADIGFEIIERVRLTVKQGFFIDQLQLGGSDRMTELEVNIRNDENLRLLSPILGRLHNEALEPMIGRILEVMMEDGAIPEDIPEELEDLSLKIFYRSQIAKAQKANEGQKISNYIGELVQLSTTLQKPEILDPIDFDELIKVKADLDAISPAIFKSNEEVEEKREADAEAAEKAQGIQEKGVEAEIAATEAKAS
jgi:hypothetical protein